MSDVPGVRALAARAASRRDESHRRRVAALQRTIAALEHEVDALQKAATAAPAEADRLGYVFVVTYGRSGSTLLAGILNSVPGYLVRGENQNYLYRLYQAHRGAVTNKRKRRDAEALPTVNPWAGIERYNEQAAYAAIRRLVVDALLQPGPDTRVTGFKEIRYTMPDVAEYLRFLREVFPGARFVFNSRNHEDVLRSKWWSQRPPRTLARVQKRLDAAERELGEAAYHVHYDDYRDNPEALRGLFEFLGEPFDAERVADVMRRRHSY